MNAFAALADGFAVALAPLNLVYAVVGVVVGSLVGVLPGLGPTATIALLLPVTYAIPPESALILLAGIYYGAMYGGSTTSILLNLPGEAASVVTTLDGYQMARQGRAGAALGIAAIGSFIAGTVAIIGLSLVAPPLARFALRFGPPEYAMLALVGLMLVVYLSGSSLSKGLLAAIFGLLLATVGQDPITAASRFTFGSIQLTKGFDFAAVAMGLFGLGEIAYNLEQTEEAQILTTKIKGIWPTMQDWVQSRWAILRGSLIGFFVGILPGGGAVISSFLAYSVEKRLAKQPERFGQGAIEGVAAPESANNAAAGASFIPLLTLGIPANSVMAMMYAALLMHGVQPGPQVLQSNAHIFWGLVASMYLGNAMLLVLNLPLVGLFVQLLRVRASILGPVAALISLLGVYSINNSFFDVWTVVVFGFLGYFMRKVDMEPGPLVLAFVLGPIIETSFRRSLLMSDGGLGIFVQRPIAAIFLALAVVLLASQMINALRRLPGKTAEQE